MQISDLTSNGNMVSPPSSTSDRYNKKEAICKRIIELQVYKPPIVITFRLTTDKHQ